MVQLRSTNPDMYDVRMEKIFYTSLARKIDYKASIFKEMSIENKDIRMSGVSGLGILSTKIEASEYSADEILQLYDKLFTPLTYGGLVRASLEAVEDDRTGKMNIIPAMFGDSQYATIQTTSAAILDNSQSTTGADSVVLCATNHPINPNSAGTFSNRPTANADLTLTVLEDAITALSETVNARNITDGLIATKLIVAPANRINAKKLLAPGLTPGDGDTTKNVVGDEGLRLIVNPYITDTDSWYLQTNEDQHEMIFIWRRKPSFKYDTDVVTDDALYKSRSRFIPGWVGARGIFGSLGG